MAPKAESPNGQSALKGIVPNREISTESPTVLKGLNSNKKFKNNNNEKKNTNTDHQICSDTPAAKKRNSFCPYGPNSFDYKSSTQLLSEAKLMYRVKHFDML